MKNMADAIESFIVGQLLAASKNTGRNRKLYCRTVTGSEQEYGTGAAQRTGGPVILCAVPDQLCIEHPLYPGKGVSGGIPPGQRGIYPYRQDIACGRTAGRTDCR